MLPNTPEDQLSSKYEEALEGALKPSVLRPAKLPDPSMLAGHLGCVPRYAIAVAISGSLSQRLAGRFGSPAPSHPLPIVARPALGSRRPSGNMQSTQSTVLRGQALSQRRSTARAGRQGPIRVSLAAATDRIGAP